MRIGKNVEHFKAAAIAFCTPPKTRDDSVLRVCSIGRQLGYGSYLTLDTVVWLNALGIYKAPNPSRLQEVALKCWMAGLLFNITAGFYKLVAIRKAQGQDGQEKSEASAKALEK